MPANKRLAKRQKKLADQQRIATCVLDRSNPIVGKPHPADAGIALYKALPANPTLDQLAFVVGADRDPESAHGMRLLRAASAAQPQSTLTVQSAGTVLIASVGKTMAIF